MQLPAGPVDQSDVFGIADLRKVRRDYSGQRSHGLSSQLGLLNQRFGAFDGFRVLCRRHAGGNSRAYRIEILSPEARERFSIRISAQELKACRICTKLS